MKLYKEGEKSRALCPFCKALRDTTFQVRTVPLSSGKGEVPDVLVGVCDECEHVVSMPQQSAPRVKEAMERTRKPVEARVPRHLLDAMVLVCFDLGFDADSSPVLFRYYLLEASSKKAMAKSLHALARSEEAAGAAKWRFSTKLSKPMHGALEAALKASDLNIGELVRGVILRAKKDVLDDRRDDVRQELVTAMRLAG